MILITDDINFVDDDADDDVDVGHYIDYDVDLCRLNPQADFAEAVLPASIISTGTSDADQAHRPSRELDPQEV